MATFKGVPGFLQLPVEIFDMIIDYYPLIPDTLVLYNLWGADPMFWYRGQVLRALSQTSRALRVQCLPRAWEYIEVCVVFPDNTHGVWYKQLSRRLERLSLGLSDRPDLCQHVQ